ncbi:MAG: NUDIX hydrolase [Lachnospiraceae bacterium]|nr:NUDIX hydrolase [Candidatus Equihabitans merdae]
MGKITNIIQQTENKFVNLFLLETIKKTGKASKYFLASRAKNVDGLKITTGQDKADAVLIYMLYGEKRDKIVLVKQYRFPVDGWIYELPAGLVEDNEDYKTAAIREAWEETGLTFTPVEADAGFERPYYMSVGMVDECCATVYGYGDGQVTDKYLESGEEIEVVLADRAEAARILKEERISMTGAMSLMHFVNDEDPLAFVKKEL